ncbi:MAG TPA: glycosyltransferase [Chromatiales bacterium]|nr:glycosyltransferase [Chromatiales bacterium]
MRYRYPEARILIFARAPEPGRVKTRLAPDLGEAAAAELQEELARHTLQMALDSRLAPVVLYCSPDTRHPFFREVAEAGVRLRAQTGRDLGARMQRAFAEVLPECDRAVLIGTDCPVMRAAYLQQAFRALEQSAVVVGPAEDGGYVLLGLRQRLAPLFTGIDWGSDRVMAQTRAALEQAETGWRELETLWDIDLYQDLQRWRRQEP